MKMFHKQIPESGSTMVGGHQARSFLLLGIAFVLLVLAAPLKAAVPEPVCNVFLDVLQTRKDPSQITMGSGSLSYIHNTESCQLNTGYVYSDDYDHGLECDSGVFATATGQYAASIDVNYTFSVESSDTDASPAQGAGWMNAPTSVTVDEENQELPLPDYDTIDQDWHLYDFSLTYQGDKRINTFDEIMHNVTIENLDGHDLEIGTFTTKGYDYTNLYLRGIPDSIKIYKLASQGSNQFFTALEANEEVRIGTLDLGSSSTDTVTIKAPKVVIDTLSLSNDNADVVIYADDIEIGDLSMDQEDRLTIYPYTSGNRVTFHANSIAASSSSSMIMSGGDYYTNDLSVPGTGTGERTFIATDSSQIVNFIINNDVTLANNPGINSEGNNGNFGDLPPANFRMFINGDLTTGGGGTTFNAIVYVEGKTDLGSPTYLRGALSSYEDITIGNDSHFTADPSVNDAGWGDCGNIAPSYDNHYSCGLFDSVLVSYEYIGMQQNDIYNACSVAVKDYNFDENNNGQPNVTCYTGMNSDTPKCTCTGDHCSLDGTCTILPEPKNRYEHNVTVSPITTTTVTSDDVTFTDLSYGNYTFTNSGSAANSQQIYFNPQYTYADNNDTKVMLLGDFLFDGNGQTLTFEGGDYYFNSFKIDKDTNGNINQINICAKDNIRIFVKEDFVYSGNHVNDEECGGKIFVYVEGDADIDASGGGSTDLPIFLYTKGDVTIEPSGDASLWYGAIVAEGSINVTGDNFNFYYDDSASEFGLGKCQMCYTDIYVSGLSFSMGSCPGFSLNLFSDIKVPIEASDPLTNVTVNEAHTGSAFSFSFMDNQEVIDQDGNHVRDAETDSSSVLNAGAFGMEASLFQDEVITYPLGDDAGNYGPTDSNDYQQLHSSTLFGFDMCTWAESLVYVAHYDDESGRHYDVVLSQCQSTAGINTPPPGVFGAWDVYRDVSDQNISTKIVNDDFNLTIASLDPTGTATETRSNKEAEYRLYDLDNNLALSDWEEFNASENATITATFQINQAVKNASVQFRFCQRKDSAQLTIVPLQDCEINPVLYEYNTTIRSDAFAIRPDHFVITNASGSSTIVAGNDFNLTLHAVDKAGADVTNYNETVHIGASSVSPLLDYNETKPGCVKGTLSQNLDINFTNGVATAQLNYSEVGQVAIRLTEKQGSEYAATDSDDTDFNATVDDSSYDTANQADPAIFREITDSQIVLSFIPDHFKISAELHNFHEGNDVNFTYVSDDAAFAMAASLQNFSIRAENEQNNTTLNYNTLCYAQPVQITIAYRVNDAPASSALSGNPANLTAIRYRLQDDNATPYTLEGNSGLGTSLTLSSVSRDIFTTDHNGSAQLTLRFNFDRNMSRPVSPFDFHVVDINVTDSNGVTDHNDSVASDRNATFYYAALFSSKTYYDNVFGTSVNTPVFVMVYDVLPSTYFRPTNRFGWFLNTIHTSGDGTLTLNTDGTTNLNNGSSSQTFNALDNGMFESGGSEISISDAGTATRPFVSDINLSGTDTWLIYNPDKDQEPSPFYRVRFIQQNGWAGYGKTGNVVESNASKYRNRRMEW